MKKILAILLAVTMMLLLVACDETNSGSSEIPDVSTEQPTSSTDKGTEPSTNIDDSDNEKEPPTSSIDKGTEPSTNTDNSDNDKESPTSDNTPKDYTFDIDIGEVHACHLNRLECNFSIRIEFTTNSKRSINHPFIFQPDN